MIGAQGPGWVGRAQQKSRSRAKRSQVNLRGKLALRTLMATCADIFYQETCMKTHEPERFQVHENCSSATLTYICASSVLVSGALPTLTMQWWRVALQEGVLVLERLELRPAQWPWFSFESSLPLQQTGLEHLPVGRTDSMHRRITDITKKDTMALLGLWGHDMGSY